MERSPLEAWIHRKISGTLPDAPLPNELSRTELEVYQLEKLRQTLDLAFRKSRFYQKHLADSNLNLTELKQLESLPFTTAKHIQENPLDFLTVSQGEIERIVTLQSSGTTGRPKRIFFTAEDQELTIDFFHQGMSTFVKPGERVLILLPGHNPGSVGDLLQKGLTRLGAVGIHHGLVRDPAETLSVMQSEAVDCLVGIPTQVLSLARYRDKNGFPVPVGVKNVLLSTDYVPDAVVDALQKAWQCRVYNHYGSTEMGLGGGVECNALKGYHLREADLYFEIVDPLTGETLPEGEYGEIVFTTLTRQGMPLIRYRTGDWSRFLLEPCACGSVLKRMEKARGRLKESRRLENGKTISLSELDEVLFSLEGVEDFTAELKNEKPMLLFIQIEQAEGNSIPLLPSAIETSLLKLSQLAESVEQGILRLKVKVRKNGEEAKKKEYNGKRQIVDEIL